MPSKFYLRQARRVALTIAAPIVAALFMFVNPNGWLWG